MKQRILVLGADGLIGRAVIAALARSDKLLAICGVRRSHTDSSVLERIVVDATDAADVSAALSNVAGVVNCVAGNERTLLASAEILVDAARRQTVPPRIVHMSSMSVYGSTIGLVDETTPLRADLGPYSAAKVRSEQCLEGYKRHVIFRPGCVIGPGSRQWTSRIADALLARRLGDLGAAGDGCCNWVLAEDVGTAVVRALEAPETDGRVYNLSNAKQPTWNEYLIAFARALGAVPVRRISARRLQIESRIIAPPLKVLEVLTARAGLRMWSLPPALPPSLLRTMSQDIRLDTCRAQRDLGMLWQSQEQALATSAAWYLDFIRSPPKRPRLPSRS